MLSEYYPFQFPSPHLQDAHGIPFASCRIKKERTANNAACSQVMLYSDLIEEMSKFHSLFHSWSTPVMVFSNFNYIYLECSDLIIHTLIIKINNFRGALTDILAKTESLQRTI